MRCKHCDYPLWNIRARQCPECGEGFRPSEFRFATNAVRFCCPHCGQDYYGTGAEGHLNPRAFDCVSCRTRVDMDEMVLQPTEGVDERFTRAERNPWLDDDKRMLSRWLGTLYRGACTPSWLLRVTPVDSAPGSAWGFAIVSHMAGAAVMIVPFLLFSLVISMLAGGGGGVGGLVGFGLVSELVVGFGSFVLLGVWVLVTHGVLRVFGKPDGGIGRTAQALCYTCGPQMVVFVPCLGFYFGWVGSLWWVVVAGFALATAQKVSGLRAALAVSVLPVVCALGLGSLLVLAVFAGASSARSAAVRAASSELGAYQAAFTQAREEGAWPAHVGELLLGGSIQPHDLHAAASSTGATDIAIGTTDLHTWRMLSPDSQAREVTTAAASLPTDTTAYRVGDFVFTYPGVDPAGPPSGLWLVVEAWDPRVPGQDLPPLVWVLLDDGTVTTFVRARVGEELATQNTLRADAGLPPLPDPFSVRADRPATTPDDPG